MMLQEEVKFGHEFRCYSRDQRARWIMPYEPRPFPYHLAVSQKNEWAGPKDILQRVEQEC